MKAITTNTGPIIDLFMEGMLPLSWKLYDKVYVQNAVFQVLMSSDNQKELSNCRY